MNTSILISGILAVLCFIFSLYMKKANPKFQIVLASGLTLYFFILFLSGGEKFSLILVLLGLSWIMKSIEQLRTNH